MPTIASILDPKLSNVQARIEAVKTKLHASGVFDGMTKELAEVAKELDHVARFAELLVIEVRGGLG